MKSGVNKNQDRIQEILRQKLEGHESEISNNLWASIENQLPQAGGAASAPTGTSWGIVQWAITAATIVGVTVGAVYFSTQKTETTPVVQQAIPDSSSTVVDKQPSEVTSIVTETATSATVSSDGNPTVNKKENISTQNIIFSEDKTTVSSTNDFNQAEPPQEKPNFSEPKESGTNTSNDFPEEQPITTVALNGRFQIVPANKENLLFLFIPEDGPEHSYEWNFGDDQTSNSASPNHTYNQEGTYEVVLKITDKEGFSKQRKETVCAYRPGKIKAPNAFSPGHDGKNDIFDLRDLSTNIETYIELSILDSNGRIIFTNSQEPTWNGQDQAGIDCQPGAYSFIAKATDKCGSPIVKAGPIQLFAR